VPQKPKPEVEPDDKEQSQRFIETVRKLESDESGYIFEDAFKSILPEKSPPNSSKNHNRDE
jgi:hypothetical protein